MPFLGTWSALAPRECRRDRLLHARFGFYHPARSLLYDRRVQILLLASHLTAKGAHQTESLSERAAAALHTGAGASINPKLWPCEDSLGLVDLGNGEYLAAVADAHWGGQIGVDLIEPLATAWGASQGQPPARLQQTLLRVEADALARRAPTDESETTLLLAHVTPTRATWLSVGDSLLFVAEGGVAARRNQVSGVFMGGAPLARLGMPALAGSCNLRAGQVVLLATDGLEPNASALSDEQVGALLSGDGDIEARLQALVDRASDPARGGGRDNLGLVAIQV